MRYSAKLLPFLTLVLAITFAACSGTGKFYKMELSTGDIFTGTLQSDLKLVTARGAKVEIPANTIDEIDFGMGRNVEVLLRDGNEFEGKLQNKFLTMKLSATGKSEEIAVSKIERFEKD